MHHLTVDIMSQNTYYANETTTAKQRDKQRAILKLLALTQNN